MKNFGAVLITLMTLVSAISGAAFAHGGDKKDEKKEVKKPGQTDPECEGVESDRQNSDRPSDAPKEEDKKKGGANRS